MKDKLQALISKHRVLLEYNPVLPTNVVDVLIESFQDSLLEYARYVVPAPDTETIYDEDSQMGGWEQCIKEINNTILEDELSLGEEEKYEFWFNTHIKCDNNHETVLCSVEKFCDYPVCPRCGSRAMVTGTNKTPMREEDTLNNK